jgi:hypothetical protein
MATQAYAVRGRRGALLERDNLGGVPSAFDVETAVAVALLALDPLLGVIGVLETLRYFRVAGGAGFGSDRRGSRYPQVLSQRSRLLGGLLCC